MSRKYISIKTRKFVSSRAKERCEYCKSPRKFSPQPFVMEHIIPLSKGGQESIDNLALACGGCNGHKYNKLEGIDPVNGNPVPLFNPRKETWKDHFVWNENLLEVLGKTPTGRATVIALKLNRKELLHLREITIIVGEHPPKD